MIRTAYLKIWTAYNWSALRFAVLAGREEGMDIEAAIGEAIKWSGRLRRTFTDFTVAEIAAEWTRQTAAGPVAALLA